MHTSILEKILESRRSRRIAEQAEVLRLTGGRRHRPVNAFFAHAGLICELKRSSPSRGVINDREPLAEILEDYVNGGAHRISVLTESTYFGGSCSDLFTLAQAHQHIPMLRKDFLYCLEDIRESYLLGADAVLLIAEMLDAPALGKLTAEARRFGMAVLTEAHSEELAEQVIHGDILPDALGINSRDLKSFKVNPLIPYACVSRFSSRIPVVLESGLTNPREAYQAGNSGFHGMLIGSHFMETSRSNRFSLVRSFITQYSLGSRASPSLFTRMFSRMRRPRPLVKICGITTYADAQLCIREGADILGFVLAPSGRSIAPSALEDFWDLAILKIAVVCNPDETQLSQMEQLLTRGIIDGVQFHGSEDPGILDRFPGNCIKAVTVNKGSSISHSYGPFVLYDLPKQRPPGRQYTTEELSELKGRFIAGGITPETLPLVLDIASPLLVDIASGVESSPGIKDPKKVREIFSLLEKCYG